MPSKSQAQHKLMEAAAHTQGGYGGVPQAVGKDFVFADSGSDDSEIIKIPEDTDQKTELDIARLIRDGVLPSPQRVGAAGAMWLFKLRITGTGVAHRVSGEYVYRHPENYLNDEFLARCNGLPVILDHPPDGKLDSSEFRDRNIGSVFLPYIDGSDVWAIAKIYDTEAAQWMVTGELSTSPSVIFRTSILENTNIQTLEGSNVLIEGIPDIIDHLAICGEGVWDRGDSGIKADNQEVNMPEIKEKDESSRADAEQGTGKEELNIDEKIKAAVEKLFEHHMKEIGKTGEKAKADSKESSGEKEDEEKEEEEKEEKAKADSKNELEKAVADSALTIKALQEQIAALAPRQRPISDYDRLAKIQSRAEEAYTAFGDSLHTCRPMDGETVMSYAKRMASGLKKYSKDWKDVDLSTLDDIVFNIAEERIYADSLVAAHSPSIATNTGKPRAITNRDEFGRITRKFVGGDPWAWCADMTQSARQLIGKSESVLLSERGINH